MTEINVLQHRHCFLKVLLSLHFELLNWINNWLIDWLIKLVLTSTESERAAASSVAVDNHKGWKVSYTELFDHYAQNPGTTCCHVNINIHIHSKQKNNAVSTNVLMAAYHLGRLSFCAWWYLVMALLTHYCMCQIFRIYLILNNKS